MAKRYFKVYLWQNEKHHTLPSYIMGLAKIWEADDSTVLVRNDFPKDSSKKVFCPVLAESDEKYDSPVVDIITGKEFKFSPVKKQGLYYYGTFPVSPIQVYDVLRQLDMSDITNYEEALSRIEQGKRNASLDDLSKEEESAEKFIEYFKTKVKAKNRKN